MTYRSRAQSLLRALKEGVGRLNRLLGEAGNSDEDLVFHIRNNSERSPLPGPEAGSFVSAETISSGLQPTKVYSYR